MNWLNCGHDIMHTCNYRMCLKIMMGHHVFFFFWGDRFNTILRRQPVSRIFWTKLWYYIKLVIYIYIPVKYLWYPFKWLVTLVSKSPKMVIPFINHPTYQPLTISGMILQVIHESLGFSGIRISDQVGYIYISHYILFHEHPVSQYTLW